MTKANSKHKPPRLSVAMLVRDAADVLAEAIDCVRPIADEIVVADLGSTDGSLEIARGGADVVAEIQWQESFAAARNECAARTTGDWILWIEPEERLDETAAQQLRNFIDEAANPDKAYLLFVQGPASGAADTCEQVGQLRLVPGGRGLQFSGRVREQVLPSVRQAGLGVDALDCVLRRDESGRDPERIRAAARQRLNLANLALTEGAETPRYLVARAEALAELGRHKEAGGVYRKAIELAERGSSEMLEAYYGLLSALDADPAAAERQMATCLEALQIYPLDAQLLCGMGSYLLRARRLELAGRSYETAATHGKVDPTIWHLADLADVAVVCWSLVLQLQDERSRAESVLRDALAERPESLRLRRQLIELLVKAGREREALAECDQLPPYMPHRAALPEVVRGALQVVAGKPAAGRVKLRSAYQTGCRDVLCLRWLAGANLAVGNLDEVETICLEWQRQEPANVEIAAFRRAVEQRRDGRPPAASHVGAPRPAGRSPIGLPITISPTGPGTSTPVR